MVNDQNCFAAQGLSERSPHFKRLPLRQANGVQAYLVTLGLFFLGWRAGVFSPARVYELFGEILSALNLFSLAFCCFLYVKACLAFFPLQLNEAMGSTLNTGRLGHLSE